MNFKDKENDAYYSKRKVLRIGGVKSVRKSNGLLCPNCKENKMALTNKQGVCVKCQLKTSKKRRVVK